MLLLLDRLLRLVLAVVLLGLLVRAVELMLLLLLRNVLLILLVLVVPLVILGAVPLVILGAVPLVIRVVAVLPFIRLKCFQYLGLYLMSMKSSSTI